MKSYDLGIISNDAELSLILTYEAERCLLSCTSSSTDLNYCRYFCIFSSTFQKKLPFPVEKVIFITSTPEKIPRQIAGQMFGILPFPFSLDELRKLFYGISRESDRLVGTAVKESDTTLTFHSDVSGVSIGHSRPILLTPGEYAILALLNDRRGVPVSREELRTVSGLRTNSNILDVHICNLRRKLESSAHRRLILTVRGHGYQLIGEQ